jgi:hypothetical protein
MLLSLAIALTTLFAGWFGAYAQAPAKANDCMAECGACGETCAKTVSFCKREGGAHAAAAHLKLMSDCATMCKTSKDFMSKGSDFQKQVCKVCADACSKCADSCATLKGKAMADCAAQCRKCATTCTKMAG